MTNEKFKNIVEFVVNSKRTQKELQEKAKAYCIDLLKSIDNHTIFFTDQEGYADDLAPRFNSYALSEFSTDTAAIQSVFLDENDLVLANLEFTFDTAIGVCLDNESELDWVELLNAILQQIELAKKERVQL